MVGLLILLVIAAGIWYYLSKQRGRRKKEAEELWTAINDSFAYLGQVVEKDDVQERLSETSSVKEAAASLSEEIEEIGMGLDGVLLGHRPGNVRRGIELEEEIEEREDEVSTSREFKQFKKELPELEARLDVWKAIGEEAFPVILPQELRDRHTYVVGKSGSGKTTLLTWMAFQDLHEGRGMAFLSPEAETLRDELLPYLPPSRVEDVIYFNPADEQCRFSFNPLRKDPGEDVDRKVEEVFTSITRVMEGGGSARINQILRQAIYALVELPDTTLLDLPRLLDRDNPGYRKQVISRLEDEQTKRFWKSTYEEFPSNAHVPILTRLAKFLRPRRVRNVLCRSEEGLDFREMMDSGKVLLCNLSDGLLGEDVSQLLGGLIMSELQLAAVGRADTPPNQRRRFYVYLDEFHSFTSHANVSYEKLLSRARKYRLPLTLAHQQTGQLPTDLVREIFGNVSTMVSFLVSRRDANRIGRECIRDDRPGQETVAPEELVTLNVGEAFTKIGTHAFPMRVTTTLDQFEADPRVKDLVVERSRRPQAEETAEAAQSPAEDRSGAESTRESEAEEVPPDPFADLSDPQDIY